MVAAPAKRRRTLRRLPTGVPSGVVVLAPLLVHAAHAEPRIGIDIRDPKRALFVPNDLAADNCALLALHAEHVRVRRAVRARKWQRPVEHRLCVRTDSPMIRDGPRNTIRPTRRLWSVARLVHVVEEPLGLVQRVLRRVV